MDGVGAINNVKSKKDLYSLILIWSSFFLYVTIFAAKTIFTAEIMVIQDAFGTTKAEASMAMTYYFIVYAIFQLILSVFMGKINLKIYLTLTAIGSAILTVLIPIMPSMSIIYILCAFNGALQAGIYSGSMQNLSKYLDAKYLPVANKVMGFGSAVSNILSYGVPAIFVGFGAWKVPFFLMAGCVFLSAIFYFYSTNKMQQFTAEKSIISNTIDTERPFITLSKPSYKVLLFVFMAFICFLTYCVYYASLNWIPSLLKQVFLMPEEYSILITICVPILLAISSIILVNVCEKHKNLIMVSIVSRIMSLILIIPMIFFFDKSLLLTIIILGLFICFTASSQSIFLGIFAFKMRRQMNSGGYLAFANAFASLAAGVAPTVAGLIIDNAEGVAGYGNLYFILSILTLLGLILMIVWEIGYSIKRKKKRDE